MPKRVSDEERQAVLRMLAEGHDRDTIAASVGVTPGQVSAISAHVKMGTYSLPEVGKQPPQNSAEQQDAQKTTVNLLERLQELQGSGGRHANVSPILLGIEADSNKEVYWNPDPATGATDPHAPVDWLESGQTSWALGLKL